MDGKTGDGERDTISVGKKKRRKRALTLGFVSLGIWKGAGGVGE